MKDTGVFESLGRFISLSITTTLNICVLFIINAICGNHHTLHSHVCTLTHIHIYIYKLRLIPPAPVIGRHDHQLKYAFPVDTMDRYKKFSMFNKTLESVTIYSNFCSFTCSIPSSGFANRCWDVVFFFASMKVTARLCQDPTVA